MGRISKLTLAAPALSISEKETGPLVGLLPAWMAYAPEAGYRPSIEPCTLVTFVPTGMGRVVILLITPFSAIYRRFDRGACGGMTFSW